MNIVRFFNHLFQWLGPVNCTIVSIWDGTPCCRAKNVQTAAAELGFTLVPLPSYGPGLNPIKGLWKWMREEVTRIHLPNTIRELFVACKAFVGRINANPVQLISRLWPKPEFDPNFEKLLVSK